jgi:hypothetical protein
MFKNKTPILLSLVFIAATAISTVAETSASVPAAIIYDNGGLPTGTTSKSGVAAPANSQWSELSTENGSNFSNTTLGAGCQTIGTTTANRCADDFVVPVGQTWTINSVSVYAYQTNSVANPFIGGTLRIWNGRPGDPGSAVIFGDTTTNRFTSATDSTWYRIGNTLGGAGGVTAAATNTARKIWQINLAVNSPVALGPGIYWIDFSIDGGANGNFSPLISIPGARSLAAWNARQFISSTSTWQDLIDIGEPAATPQPNVVPDVIMEFPFKLDGSITGAPLAPTSRFVDFDGDNRTDYTVVRSASATTQSTWWINSAGVTGSSVAWGLGVGFSSSNDKATPADFDGDGKTDIAVWRFGLTSPGFWILQSSDGTVRFEPFGALNDDTSIVDDYDGDGKADPAVYRAGASGTFFYRGSLNNPSGNITYVPWGTTGDRALPGDFDGDGKADFHVVRDSGGLAQHWTLLTGGGTRTVQYGLTNDKFLTGDFDADGRTDVAAVRANGVNYDWYVLRSATASTLSVQWGNPATDFLTPGDYDGDNRTDFAVWRSGGGAASFYIKGSSSATRQFAWGQSAAANTAPDYPIAAFIVK